MKKLLKPVSLFIIISMLSLSSCISQNHRVEFKAPKTNTPVSASSYYITEDMQVIPPEDYLILDHFVFSKELKGPVTGTHVSELIIDEELNEAIGSIDARAVVNFEVYADSHDSGNLGGVIFTRIFGWTLLGCAVPFLFVDGLRQGGVYMGVPAGISLAASYIMPGSSASTWVVGVEGDLVKPAE